MSDAGNNGGILFSSFEEDCFEIHRVFEFGIEQWNSNWAGQQGVVIGVNKEAVEVASTLGGKIMYDSFPTSPDAFKRVAALLVMMALHPFVIGRAADPKGMYVRVLQGDDLRPFAIRFVVDSLPLIFGLLDQNVTKDGIDTWVTLNKWKGFRSNDLRDEFIKLLYSISKSDVIVWEGPVLKYRQDRLSRGILAVSLTLKAAYGEV
ncbi:MAG: hypothetical protein ABSF51_03400 [Verrucomicrobiota bacterium]|jgi:hypothetical protein